MPRSELPGWLGSSGSPGSPGSPGSSGSRGAGAAGLMAVTATYVAFLLHAQFGFLALLEARAGGRHVQAVMAAMGLAGLAASLVAGALLRRSPPRRLVAAGLAGCVVVPLAALGCRSPLAFGVAAVAVGIVTGLLTVSLASGLRQMVPGPHRGLKVGGATGIAYLVANLPPLFHGGPVVQAIAPALACAVALAALLVTGSPARDEQEPAAARGALRESDCRGLGFATLVASFLALVWLDSAAFRIVQETPHLQAGTWGVGTRTLGMGVVHLVAALLAGHLVDRGQLRSLLLATFATFSIAFGLLSAGVMPGGLAGPLYAVGISTYSTALVLAPSLVPDVHDATGLLPVRWRAALLYAVAGWAGSALGVGMAQDLRRIPAAFTIAAGSVLVGGALLARGALLETRPRLGDAARVFGPALLLALLAVLPILASASPGSGPMTPPAAIERGRAVYVAEGCISCHSQFVRPGSDEEAWGPRRLDQMQEAPPLIGVRRIGPDLLDVGNRRSGAWEALHLRDPRALEPGSSMPSYAHLFDAGDRRGDDLVAYLASLGAGTLGERAEAVRSARVPSAATGGDPLLGRRIFRASCAPCHGERGDGSGPLAASVRSPFLDLRMPGFPRVERVTGDLRSDLARVVRFGICGTSMPGHEILTDAEVASVADHVLGLAPAPAPTPTPTPNPTRAAPGSAQP